MLPAIPPQPAPTCDQVIVNTTTYNVPMFLGSIIDLMESVTKDSKGLSWYDGSEIIAYRSLCTDKDFINLLQLTGTFPIRDNYGEAWSKYESFKYNDVTYRLIPVSLMNSINYFINQITLPNPKQE